MSKPKQVEEFPIDPSSPLFVGASIITCTIAGGITGALIGLQKKILPEATALSMATNSGIAATAFFGTREYLVSPILLGYGVTPSHVRRAAILRGEDVPQYLSLSDMRMDRMLDTAIAGAISGGGISLLARGPRTMLPAAFTASLIVSAAQLTVNQARVMRVEWLARRERAAPVEAVEKPGLGISKATFEDARKDPDAVRGDAPITGAIINFMSTFLPITKINDQEYLDLLERKRDKVVQRLREIEDEQTAIYQVSHKE